MIYHFLLGSKWVVLWQNIKSKIHAVLMSWKSWAPYSLLSNSHNDFKCYRQKPHTGNYICEKMWAQRVSLATGVLLLKWEMKNRLPSVQWDLIVRSQWKGRALRFLTWVLKGPWTDPLGTAMFFCLSYSNSFCFSKWFWSTWLNLL